jgi:glyoxylase-like metal-dependent hydrolase (beta-lactamase superfamily II)
MSRPAVTDTALEAAIGEITRALGNPELSPAIETYFDEATNAATHIVWDRATRKAAVIDSVLDFDPPSGAISTTSADRLLASIDRHRLEVDWLIETHVHADHLTAAHFLKQRVGGRTAISREVTKVQQIFGERFNLGQTVPADGSAFDRLLDEGDRLPIGGLGALALRTPGHTPADMSFVVGDTVFVGDTIFMPDWGTARADFPGADPTALYRSIRRLLSLPMATKLRPCHDYKTTSRDIYHWATTVGDERAGNVHVRDGVSEEAFVSLRMARDATLPIPRLFYPSLQVNIRGGRLPEPDPNGSRYLKIPLTAAI